MSHSCIICGKPVTVIGAPEIVSCENDNCIKTVEDFIGLHYQSPEPKFHIDPSSGESFAGIITFKGGNVTNIQRFE